MSLGAVVDEVVTRVGAAVGPGVTLSDLTPLAAADLPHATVSVEDADRPHVGIGGIPQTPETGALPVTVSVDLADPTLRSGDETLLLVDAARTTLVVPNGPIVKADGTDDTPFTAGDLTVTDPGGAYTVVAGPPGGREVVVDHLAGVLRFGQPLPAAGTLAVTFHVGAWDVTVLRFTGSLHVDVAAAADTSGVTRQVAAAVEALGPPFERLVPTAWGPAEPVTVGDTAARRRRLTYEFAFEQRRPAVGTSGGIIRTVEVTSNRDAPEPADRAAEDFAIPVPAVP